MIESVDRLIKLVGIVDQLIEGGLFNKKLTFKKTIFIYSITSNTGIGLFAAAGLSFRGPQKIILGCRNVEATEEVIERMKKNNEFNPNCTVVIKELDLLSLNKVSVGI